MDTDTNLEEPVQIPMADSGNGSSSSFSLTDSGDAIHQTSNYVVALHRKMVIIIDNEYLILNLKTTFIYIKYFYIFIFFI